MDMQQHQPAEIRTKKGSRAPAISDEEWEIYRGLILYLIRNCRISLSRVIEVLRYMNFTPSKSQLDYRLRHKWCHPQAMSPYTSPADSPAIAPSMGVHVRSDGVDSAMPQNVDRNTLQGRAASSLADETPLLARRNCPFGQDLNIRHRAQVKNQGNTTCAAGIAGSTHEQNRGYWRVVDNRNDRLARGGSGMDHTAIHGTYGAEETRSDKQLQDSEKLMALRHPGTRIMSVASGGKNPDTSRIETQERWCGRDVEDNSFDDYLWVNNMYSAPTYR